MSCASVLVSALRKDSAVFLLSAGGWIGCTAIQINKLPGDGGRVLLLCHVLAGSRAMRKLFQGSWLQLALSELTCWEGEPPCIAIPQQDSSAVTSNWSATANSSTSRVQVLYGRKEQVVGRELLLETEKSRIGQLHRKAECVRNKIPACGIFLVIVQLPLGDLSVPIGSAYADP